MKPWLLDVHPMVESAESVRAFVRAPQDTLGDDERSTPGGSAKTLVWSSGFGAHKKGRYFDYVCPSALIIHDRADPQIPSVVRGRIQVVGRRDH